MWKRYSTRWPLNNLFRDWKVASVKSNTSVEVRKVPNLYHPCRNLIGTCANKNYIQVNERRLYEHKWKQLRKYSEISGETSVQFTTKETPVYYRTQETDPRKHDERHLGRIYTMPGMFVGITLRMPPYI